MKPWDRSERRAPPAAAKGGAATGMTPLGLGNDGFASLRWPVQRCGIAALRPTLGRISHAATVDMIDMPIGGQFAELGVCAADRPAKVARPATAA